MEIAQKRKREKQQQSWVWIVILNLGLWNFDMYCEFMIFTGTASAESDPLVLPDFFSSVLLHFSILCFNFQPSLLFVFILCLFLQLFISLNQFYFSDFFVSTYFFQNMLILYP